MNGEKKEDKLDEVVIKSNDNDDGVDTTRLSTEVIATLVGVTAGEVPGIAGMSGGIVGGIAEKLGRKDLTRGIKVNLEENNRVKIDLYIIVEYGVSIAEVSRQLIKMVRENIEFTTGLTVESVNVNVQGVSLSEEKDKRKDRQEQIEETEEEAP